MDDEYTISQSSVEENIEESILQEDAAPKQTPLKSEDSSEHILPTNTPLLATATPSISNCQIVNCGNRSAQADELTLAVDVERTELALPGRPRADTLTCNERYLAIAAASTGLAVYRITEDEQHTANRKQQKQQQRHNPEMEEVAVLHCVLPRSRWLCLQPGQSDVLVFADSDKIRLWHLDDIISKGEGLNFASSRVIGEHFHTLSCCHLAPTPATIIALGVDQDVWLLDYVEARHSGTLYGLESRVYSAQITGELCTATSVQGQVIVWNWHDSEVIWTWNSKVPSPAVCVEMHLPVSPSIGKENLNSQSVDPYRQSIDLHRQSIDLYRQSVDRYSQSVDLNRQSIDLYRQSVDRDSQSVDLNRQPIDLHRQSIDPDDQSSVQDRQSVDPDRHSVDLSAVAWASGRITVLVTSEPACPELVTLSLTPPYSPGNESQTTVECSIIGMKAVRLRHEVPSPRPLLVDRSQEKAPSSRPFSAGRVREEANAVSQFGPHGLLLALTSVGDVHVISTSTWLSSHVISLSHSGPVSCGGIFPMPSSQSLILACALTMTGKFKLCHIKLKISTQRKFNSRPTVTTQASPQLKLTSPRADTAKSSTKTRSLRSNTRDPSETQAETALNKALLPDQNSLNLKQQSSGNSEHQPDNSSLDDRESQSQHSTVSENKSLSPDGISGKGKSRSTETLPRAISSLSHSQSSTGADRSMSELLISPEVRVAPPVANVCTIDDTTRALSVLFSQKSQRHRLKAESHVRKQKSRKLRTAQTPDDVTEAAALPYISEDYRELAVRASCCRSVHPPVVVYGRSGDQVTCLAVSGRGTRVACTSRQSNTVEVLKLSRTCQPVMDKFMAGSLGRPVSLSWTLDGENLLGAFSGGLLLWQNPITETMVTKWQPESTRAAKCCGGGGGRTAELSDANFFYMDAFILAAIGNRMCVLKYNDSSVDVAGYCDTPCHQIFTAAAENRCCCPLALAACSDHHLRLLDMSTTQCVGHLLPQPRRNCRRAQLCASIAATLSPTDGVRVWDVRTCRLAQRLLLTSSSGSSVCSPGYGAETASVSAFAVSPDGSTVAAGACSKTAVSSASSTGSCPGADSSFLWFWDLRWPQVPSARVRVAGAISDLAFHPRKAAVVCAVGSGSLQSVYIQQ